MKKSIIQSIFGNDNDRYLKKWQIIVDEINKKEDSIKSLKDEDLKIKTNELKERLNNGENLDDILPEAFALVREASLRVYGERHYDVQLQGGIAIHKGNIAEMRTGEGKTLVAT